MDKLQIENVEQFSLLSINPRTSEKCLGMNSKCSILISPERDLFTYSSGSCCLWSCFSQSIVVSYLISDSIGCCCGRDIWGSMKISEPSFDGELTIGSLGSSNLHLVHACPPTESMPVRILLFVCTQPKLFSEHQKFLFKILDNIKDLGVLIKPLLRVCF